jgi:tetratricopeptide (TPR) repeat protein
MHPTVPHLQYAFPDCVCPARTGKAKAMMSKQIADTLFMFSPLTAHAEFYQEVLRGLGNLQHLYNRLVLLGEQAHAFRRFDRVREVGNLLSTFSPKNCRAVGHYFLAVAANNNGAGDQQQARVLFELAADTAPERYKAKSILSLAAVSANTGDYASELYYFRESLKAAPKADLYTLLKAHKGIAVVQAREGSHKRSLSYLETFLPLARHAEPPVYFDYLNSYAVELGEAGRRREARNVSRLVVASPFAHAYPEWGETADDLGEPHRPIVAINPSQYIPHNVLFMPVTEPGERAAMLDEPARVLDLQEWKDKMGKGKNGDGEKPGGELKAQEMLMRIMEAYISHDATDEQRRKIYEYALKVLSDPDNADTPAPDELELDDTEDA